MSLPESEPRELRGEGRTSSSSRSSTSSKAAAGVIKRKNTVADPMRPYIIASGIAGATVVGGILVAWFSPEKTASSIYLADSTMADHANNNAPSWTAAAPKSFEGWMLADIKRFNGIGVSARGVANVQSCGGGVENQAQFIPKAFDSRTKWASCFEDKKIYNMGNCTSSWAITAAGMLSNRFCISDPELYGNMTLAPQHLLSCDTTNNRGCWGGDIDTPHEYMMYKGIVHESCFPYQAKDSVPCTKKFSCADKQRHKATSHCVLLEAKEIKLEIQMNGPVVGIMYVYDDLFVYKSGVYQPMTTSVAVMDRQRNPLTHAVKIIGWGVEHGLEYWLIENSFGKDWGEGGFAKIRRSSGYHPEYNPMTKRDVIIWEHYVMSATPYSKRMREIDAGDNE